MPLNIKKVKYFNFTVGDHAGEGSKLLTWFAAAGNPQHCRFKFTPDYLPAVVDVQRAFFRNGSSEI